MNEENFCLQSTLEANYLNIELPEQMDLDEIAVHVIKKDCPDFLIPFRLLSMNGKTTLKYKLVNTIALKYSDKNLNRNQFLKLYLNLIKPFMDCGNWFLDYHNFCVNPQYIFVDKQSLEISFIYVPEKSYHNEDKVVLNFFKDTFTTLTIVDAPELQVKIYQFFSRENVNLSDLYDLLVKESQNTAVKNQRKVEKTASVSVQEKPEPQQVMQQNVIVQPVQYTVSENRKQPERKLPFFTQKKAEPVKEENLPAFQNNFAEGEDQEVNAVVEALFGDNKKKEKVTKKTAQAGVLGLFGKKKKNNGIPAETESFGKERKIPVENITKSEPVASDIFMQPPVPIEDDRTEIEGDGYEPMEAHLELIDSVIPGAIQRISLNFTGPYITIGRISSDEVKPDIAFGKEFNRIGRKHARIEKNGENYYIIDLGSANHTVLNGQVLIPNQPYLLQDGAELVFTVSKPVRYRICF